MKKIPTLLCDFYKVNHRILYPVGTEMVYSTWTPRTSRLKGIDHVVAYGFQGFIKKYLIDFFNEEFFGRPKLEIVTEYTRILKHTLGTENPDSSHIEALHDLGYLPILIKALPEGTKVPLRVPMLTIENTHKDFFWLTNYLETLMSCELWMAATSATIANDYYRILSKYAIETVGNADFVPFQGHDFSMRGMSCLESAAVSGSAHLLSFVGTDTIPAIVYHEEYYNANVEAELVGTSIPATEHSISCANGMDEFATFKRLMTEVHPTGFLSLVSDTWDFWGVLENVVKPLKETIMNRDGKIVIRPDSGCPVKIICGDPESDNELIRKGTVEVLWDIFGGTVSEQGYKVLDSHIGCIYGDAITRERAEEICKQLKAKGFASTNCVYGIGSFSYQYNTRDTFGFALKSTLCEINGEEVAIFKDPKTDDGTKKSQMGRVSVCQGKKGLYHVDDYNRKYLVEQKDLLEPIFNNGKLLKDLTLSGIRETLKGQK